ncbi:MAG: ABC transporter ATP-binding protein [Pseudomonadota bacterium]
MNFAPHLERLRLLRPVRGRLAAALLCMGAGVLIQLGFPRAIAWFIDHAEQLRQTGIPPHLVLAMVGAAILLALVSALRYYLFQSASQHIVTRLRRQLFGVLIRQPIGFFDQHHVGELTSRLHGDVMSLHESLTIGAANVLRSLCVFGGGVAMLLSLSPLLSVPLALFIPASLYLGKRSGNSYRERAREVQASLADSGKVAQEHFANVRLVHAFNQQAGASARYGTATARALAAALSNARLLSTFQGLMSLLLYLALISTLCFGAWLIGQGRLSVGELTAFIIYATMVTEAANALTDFWGSWMRTLGATDRVFELLRLAPRDEGGAEPPSLSGRIVFDNVGFRYPQRPAQAALEGVNLALAAGETVALVGPSGAGKSTIANLLLGHYAPGQGRILFDGLDAAALAPSALRRHVAVVEQEPALFSGSIADNIRFAVPEREVTQAEVEAVARRAQAHDFILGFPDGYDTVVGERGVQLSGGQKQRIAIARAMLRDPAILILDEATSALDAASETLVQAGLDRLMQGRTTIIIAHRLSTIVSADRIVVLAGGRICQQGSHAELLRQGEGPYAELMRHQLAQYGRLDAPLETV